MEERIQKFMEHKGITPSELADAIGVQRSNVTHVLKARNKPSFQFIEKLLQVYPEINAKWLLLGQGNMIEGMPKSRTLFDPVPEPIFDQVFTEKKKEPEIAMDSAPAAPKETISTPPAADKKGPENELHDSFFSAEKPIERMIVFFKDQTFKVYNPSR